MCFYYGFKDFFHSQKVGKERIPVGKFSAQGHATRPSYGGPKIDSPDFPVDFALWNFASVLLYDEISMYLNAPKMRRHF